jgi:hypothetical protein
MNHVSHDSFDDTRTPPALLGLRRRTPTFSVPVSLAGWLVRPAMGYLAVLSFIFGCQSLPPLDMTATNQEAMFPTLKLNEDLFRSFTPSNHRNWVPEQAVLATAEFHGSQVTVHNIRNCRWYSPTDFTVAHYDKTYDLNDLRSVDFIVVPFNEMPALGHTMLSFCFGDQGYLAVSVEMRKEQGQEISETGSVLQQYGLIYVVADERDVILKRVSCDLSGVYLYRSRATPKEAKILFKDVMRRVNQLAGKPEFYDALTNNCATNIRDHVNRLYPNEIPYDYRVLLPGYSDELAYDLGLVDHHGSFAETRLQASINYQAYLYRDDPDFSAQIRK